MDVGFISLTGDQALYLQIYSEIKSAIEEGRLGGGQELPSIRSLGNSLSVSKITVEKAYEQLYSEGYILKRNRARYRVAAITLPEWAEPPKKPAFILEKKRTIRFNFSAGEMDEEGFDFEVWRRNYNRTLDQKQRLVTYGERGGELDLRQEIANYLFQSRGVGALPEQIIVGANTQVLLGLVSSLLSAQKDEIAFEDPGFKQGRQVFQDYGFKVHPVPMAGEGLNLTELEKSPANVCYVSPSHQFPTGAIMPIGQRSRLLQWANKKGHLIIEDDYDSEFRYYGHPIPALKGLDRQDKVVYIGSFSKILPPSIRISYMVLPLFLMERFSTRETPMNQTASTLEQITLAAYMKEGSLDRQIRRLRKRYQEKRELFLQYLQRHLGQQVQVFTQQSGLFVIIQVLTPQSPKALEKKALEAGCLVSSIQSYSLSGVKDNRLLLYFSGLPLEKLEAGVLALKNAWQLG